MIDQTNIQIASNLLLEPENISLTQIQKILSNVMTNQINLADIYFQATMSESWAIENGCIKNARYSTDKGAGVRTVASEKTGFAYTNEITLNTIEHSANAAKAIASQGQEKKIQISQDKYIPPRVLYPKANPILSLDDYKKIELLKKIDRYVRKKDKRVKQVIASFNAVSDVILVIASDGTLQADIRPLVQMNIIVVVEFNDRIETGTCGGGHRGNYSMFLEHGVAFDYANQALRQALVNLEAVNAPAGTMPVILGPGWPGVLLHEAIGHGLEGDFNRKGSSAFSNRIGERVASPLCTIVDDGTLKGRCGSLNIDDEGMTTQCTILIEKGILKNYIQDKMNAKLMGMVSTGNGRRESYAHLPMPRMTNTYMLNGSNDSNEIIQSVDKGIYAVNFAGGQVDITSGKFVFNTSEAYLIRKGKVTTPIKGATLIGHGPDVLTKISMVGNDLKLDNGIGICSKEGQSVSVGVGQPTLKIDEMTVGGTKSYKRGPLCHL